MPVLVGGFILKSILKKQGLVLDSPTLIAVMSEIGDVVVVAPDKPQSAMGHAITINNMLYLNKVSAENAAILEYNCSGTPVDCVKLAVNEILKQKGFSIPLSSVMVLNFMY